VTEVLGSLGNDSVQIWFFQEQGSDVIKGELPFVVGMEDIES
jgi:hypothetical protein